MEIMLTHLRIKNFRSLENIDLKLGMTNILIGQNNSGKSNLLRAVNIALGGCREVSESDIFIRAEERLARDKIAIIDILLKPISSNGESQPSFSDFWTNVFTESWITTDDTNGDFVGIRTIIKLDVMKNDYIITKYSIKEWGNSIDDVNPGNKNTFGNDMNNYLKSFYMDANRDVVEDIGNKKSYFGKATSHNDLSEDTIIKLETQLNEINNKIIENIPALKKTKEALSSIEKTMGSSSSIVEIESLARNISDLHKGMDITYKDGENSAQFSVSKHGMGTRSWISFLILGAYVDWDRERNKIADEETDNYVMLTMEEPEAHLHPQAQRQLYSEITKFYGQKIISTHSPSILAQANIKEVIHVDKSDGKTKTTRIDDTSYSIDELNKIQREVINTRGELLFCKAIILCEGITEEQALPLYFKEYFKVEPINYGINIIAVHGRNYKPFLNLIKNLNILWFIFSDGEKKTIDALENSVKLIMEKELSQLPNIIIIDNHQDYEKHLISNGYQSNIISAINEYEKDDECFNKYKKSTQKPSNNKDNIIYNFCTKKGAKAQYALCIAQEIVLHQEPNKRIPPKIKELFIEIQKTMSLDVTKDDIND